MVDALGKRLVARDLHVAARIVVPSPDTSMVRRGASKRRARELRGRKVDAAAD